MFFVQVSRGWVFLFTNWGFRGLPTHYLQIHATWVPVQSVCAVLNPESSKANIIVTLATDVVLLLIMLAGLLRLRQNGVSLALVQFLWTQVGTVGPLVPMIAHTIMP
jgi:hypothetical protein